MGEEKLSTLLNLVEEQTRELAELRERAEEANIAKARFLANMSHEIRTPLGAVLGFADILAQNPNVNPGDRMKFSEAIRRNGQLLLKLVDDVLELSRIEAGKVELEKSDFSLEALVNDIMTTMSVKAKEKGLQITCSNTVGNRHFIGDVSRIKQILLNLVSNAMKFTEKGRVELSVDVNDLKIEFRVRDTGLGLNIDEAKRLFQRFSQADASTKKRYGGSGLGLMISKQLASEMSGDVVLEATQPGQGSTFLFWMPLTDATRALELGTIGPNVRSSDILLGKKILFVDDCPDNHDLVRYMFFDSGALLGFAFSGVEGLELMRQHDFDCCLMDVQMPGMDGIETTRNARSLGFDRPIIALTAFAGQAERQKCLEAGCVGVITKPIDRDRLFLHLESVLR